MIVVSDTSPITSLSAVGQLELLHQLYGSVVIPQSVYEELTNPPNQPGGAEVQSEPWIVTKSASNQAMVSSLLLELDPGEAEAIALAIELGADLLVMDERLGRRVAQRFALKLVGTVGILVEAKRQGLIPAVKAILDLLKSKGRFRMSETLYREVLNQVNESE